MNVIDNGLRVTFISDQSLVEDSIAVVVWMMVCRKDGRNLNGLGLRGTPMQSLTVNSIFLEVT